MPTLELKQGWLESNDAFKKRREQEEQKKAKADLLAITKESVAQKTAEAEKKFQELKKAKEEQQKKIVATPLGFDPAAQHEPGSKTYLTPEKREQIAIERKAREERAKLQNVKSEEQKFVHVDRSAEINSVKKHVDFLVRFAKKPTNPKPVKTQEEIKQNYQTWQANHKKALIDERERKSLATKQKAESVAKRDLKFQEYVKNSYEKMKEPHDLGSRAQKEFKPIASQRMGFWDVRKLQALQVAKQSTDAALVVETPKVK